MFVIMGTIERSMRMKKKLPVLIIVVLILLVLGGFAFSVVYKKYSYTDERADLKAYYDLSAEDEVAIVLGDEMIEDKALLRDGTYYLELGTVHAYFNERFYLDNSAEGNALLIYTTTDTNYRTVQNSTVVTSENGEETMDYPVMLYENEVCYVAIDYVVRFTDMEYETFSEPARMQIYNEWPERTVGVAKKDTQVRLRGGVKSEILTDVSEGEVLTVLEELESWYKVKTDDAYIGYVPKKHVKEVHSYVVDRVSLVEEIYYPARVLDERVNMGWHQVLSYAANSNVESVIAGTNINVIAPTWFLLSGNTGEYVNNASASYVNYAHAQGIVVWAVIDNFNMDCNLYEILRKTSQRDALVNNLVSDCVRLGIDGINVDFEQVSPDNANHYIQFIRELSVACHKNDLILSVDNYVPTAYTSFYNREEQGRYADYVVIMGYDEHTSGSENAGSVASLGFVEEGIVNTLDKVEAAKVINGIPFYTRGWATSEDGISIKTLSMGAQKSFIREHGIEVAWDEEWGQYYGENTVDGVSYEIWMEETESLREKLAVMNQYDIAGVAQWKLGLETDDVWAVIEEYMGN